MSSPNLKSLIYDACVLEARARKPGNVHPEAAFNDLCFADFVLAAEAVAEVFSNPSLVSVGSDIFAAVQATREKINRNTNPNLGIVLLLAPLVAVAPEVTLAEGIESVLSTLTVEDANQVYAAIRLANPGGMGKVKTADVSDAPAITLRDAMRLAADRDLIASEYSTGFQILFQTAVPFLAAWPNFEHDWEDAILQLQLVLMSYYPDTLIARKCGREVADESAIRAAHALKLGGMKTEPGREAVRQLDQWLRVDGHRRNPGTTADLIAAALFAAARDGMINLSGARFDATLRTSFAE